MRSIEIFMAELDKLDSKYTDDAERDEILHDIASELREIEAKIIDPKLSGTKPKMKVQLDEKNYYQGKFMRYSHIFCHNKAYKICKKKWTGLAEISDLPFQYDFNKAFNKAIQEKRDALLKEDYDPDYKVCENIVRTTDSRLHDKYRKIQRASKKIKKENIDVSEEIYQSSIREEEIKNKTAFNLAFKKEFPKKHWRVFMRWGFFCSPSISNTAKVFDMTEGTVKQRRYKLKRDLKKFVINNNSKKWDITENFTLDTILNIQSYSTAKNDFVHLFKLLTKKIFKSSGKEKEKAENTFFDFIKKQFSKKQEKEILLRWIHFITNADPVDQANAFEFTSMEDFYLYRYDVVKELNEALKN